MPEPSIRGLLIGALPDTLLFQNQLSAVAAQNLEITQVNRLEQALDHLAGGAFDIVILDLSIAGKRGMESVRAIRSRKPDIPILWLNRKSRHISDPAAPPGDVPQFVIETIEDPSAIWEAIRYATLRARSEKDLKENEERFRISGEAAHAMVYEVDLVTGRGKFVRGLDTLLGYSPDEETSRVPDWWFSQIHKDDLPAVREELKKARSRGADYSLRYRVRHSSGNYIIVEDSGRNILDRERRVVRCIGSVMDITEREQSAEALRESEQRYHDLAEELERLVGERTADIWKLNRTLEMITGCSKAIVRAVSEQELLSEICRIIVELGEYAVAWVGLAQQDEAMTILPVANAGVEGMCLKSVRSSWTNNDRSVPAAEAIRTGKPSGFCGLQKNPAEQSRCGHCCSIALPLKSEGQCFGALTICGSDHSVFDEDRVEELAELADDLAFGIFALRTRDELRNALRDLEQRSAQLRMMAVELTQAEERERKRLAEAIHDDLQQLLVASKFAADALAGGVKEPKLKNTAQQLNQFLTEAIESTRSLSFELSPPILHSTGLAKALHYLAKRMEAKHGLIVTVRADEAAEPENRELRVLLFQSAGELLFNIVKHAGVKKAEIDMRRAEGDCLQITVTDEGAGFNPEKCVSENTQNGFGLFSIRGRLDLIGGRFEIRSSPGAGSRCTMIAPLGKSAAAEMELWEQKPAPEPQARPKGGLIRAGQKPPAKDSRKSK